MKVTSVTDLQDKVWGVAYNISDEDQEEVMAYLDHREKDGYQRVPVLFHPQDNTIQPWHLIIYLGTVPSNIDISYTVSSF